LNRTFTVFPRALVAAAVLGLAPLCVVPATAQTPKPLPTKQLTPANMVSPKLLMTRIDTNCAVFKDAMKSQKPTDVLAMKSSTYRLASTSDIETAKKSHSSFTMAEVWKQAGNYQWVRAYTAGSSGGHHAAQLCFRNDGTIARVKQSATIPSLDASGASVAYYNTDGSVIQKTTAFDMGDTLIVKRVKDLPYYKILP